MNWYAKLSNHIASENNWKPSNHHNDSACALNPLRVNVTGPNLIGSPYL